MNTKLGYTVYYSMNTLKVMTGDVLMNYYIPNLILFNDSYDESKIYVYSGEIPVEYNAYNPMTVSTDDNGYVFIGTTATMGSGVTATATSTEEGSIILYAEDTTPVTLDPSVVTQYTVIESVGYYQIPIEDNQMLGVIIDAIVIVLFIGALLMTVLFIRGKLA